MYSWDQQFLDLYDRCLEKYRAGDHDFNGYYSEEELGFLRSIGCQPREFFDFVEDFAVGGDPTPSTAVLITDVRRNYLKSEMGGKLSDHVVDPASLPPKTEEMDGIIWLPRIITKARAKLRGELDPNSMFCCGGDRKFLRTHNIAPADFLHAVWEAGDDDSKILAFVKANSPVAG